MEITDWKPRMLQQKKKGSFSRTKNPPIAPLDLHDLRTRGAIGSGAPFWNGWRMFVLQLSNRFSTGCRPAGIGGMRGSRKRSKKQIPNRRLQRIFSIHGARTRPGPCVILIFQHGVHEEPRRKEFSRHKSTIEEWMKQKRRKRFLMR